MYIYNEHNKIKVYKKINKCDPRTAVILALLRIFFDSGNAASDSWRATSLTLVRTPRSCSLMRTHGRC